MARGLAGVLEPGDLTVVVNVGDDQTMYGVHVAADLDTVTYTLAGIEGPHGWGIADDVFTVMDHLETLGVDTSFRLGDRDLATCLLRTSQLGAGVPLSTVTGQITTGLGVEHRILPATDDRVPTKVRIADGSWLDFQDYFVVRRHNDEVAELEYEGASEAHPAPGVVEAIEAADRVILAPSNPPLSVWPMLAIPDLRNAVAAADSVIAVSPLIGGKALKGPADRVMSTLGLSPGNRGVLEAYDGLLSHLIVHDTDAPDVDALAGDVEIVATNTLIGIRPDAEALARKLLQLG
jgi:LPPG:FO 2-phospho-L-lactate transferase